MDHYIFAGDRNTYLSGGALTDPDNIPGITALAHALSLTNRFTGHTIRPYSVAEHSLLCCEIARNRPGFNERPLVEQAEILMACLTHDLHEALVGDVSSPIKHIIGPAWSEFEDAVESAVRRAHNVELIGLAWADEVKACVLVALATEKRDLLPGSGTWRALEGVEPADHLELDKQGESSAAYWQQMFIYCYVDLWVILKGAQQ